MVRTEEKPRLADGIERHGVQDDRQGRLEPNYADDWAPFDDGRRTEIHAERSFCDYENRAAPDEITSEAAIKAFDGVCCVNNLANNLREFEDWRNDIPVCKPTFHNIMIIFTPRGPVCQALPCSFGADRGTAQL